MTSVFRHLGEFGQGEEWQLLPKTRAERYPDLAKHLLAHHPWDNPEVSPVPIAAGSELPLRRISTSVGTGESA
ncbi:divalent cation tolerance protein CutA [Streptomyces qinglanensis]|uniref:divalent cation tolerance protein CutA n=1 Tax=Streptomyces qinglanensis TaxID=943816 RepID=UPI003D765F88